MKILLVDDETSVLQPLMGALRGLDGHDVRPAISAEKALANAESLGGIDLLIADVVMEPMNGFQLRDELAARYPGVRAIFLTEYDLSEYTEQIAGAPVLAKPVDPETLIATVRSEVEAAAAAAQEPAPVEEPAPLEVPVAEEPPAPVAVPVGVPVAVPRAVPVAVPKAVAAAVPTVKAVPAAPKAVPAAPRAVPATPQAVPAAPRVVASPQAVPAAPKAVPAAVPVAKAVPAAPTAVPAAPKAVPAAPKVVPAATPAAPRVVASPVAVPAAPKVVGAPTATPKAVPAVPKAVPAAPRAVPVAQPIAPSAAVPVAPMEAEAAAEAVEVVPVADEIPNLAEPSAVAMSLIGQMIGGYQIVSLIGQGRWGPVFAAVQVSINRPVGLKVLDPDKAADETQKARFIADARAKANVQHPSILSVFEAGSADEWIFYTHEYVDGQSLAEMAASGHKIDQPTVLKMLKATAEGLLYFERNNIPHTPLEPGDVFLGADGLSRLTNLATQLADQPTSTAVEMESLGRALMAVLPPGAAITPPMRALLGRTQRAHNAPLANWEALLNGVKALEPKIVPVEAAKISAQDRAAVEAVEKARAQQRRSFMINLGAMLSLMLLAAYALYAFVFKGNMRRLDAQIYIPAGEFIFGAASTPQQLPEFWIDKYEVSIGQYAKFVKFIEDNPGEEHSYDHPEQPRGLSHVPQYWTIYYQNALAQTTVHSVDQSLNSPAMVKWWDAYAYAKWRGRDLPTEQEWERAARGKRGQAFTFGEEPDPRKANTNADYNEHDPKAKAKVDGFTYWGDVDAQTSDKSPDGVIGMQGNVSEWTGTRDASTKFPVIKGGNFKDPLQPLTWRKTDVPPNMQDEWLGFRTVSHEAPKK